uniref:F-box domain-containing protein n=1 Tax=Culex tarsalis TaxID=7177 RepID=A0A1Q3EW65_CULTA
MEESSQQLQHPSPVLRHNYSGASQQQHQHKLFKDHSADGSGHLADSGYNSYHSINASCSVARSVLATIEEDNETAADSSFEEPASASKEAVTGSILTPTTTASMELISNFHLTTPKENLVAQRRTLARKPTCQNLFALRTPEKSSGSSCVETPVRSGRKSAELGALTPRKTKNSAKRKNPSFREKLYSDGDVESRENDCKKLDQEDISPIFHNKRRRNSAIDDFIRSSTPKTAGFRSNFHVEAQENQQPAATRKPLGLRKFQSFSPSKMHSYRKRDTVLQEKSVLANRKAPLQRQNAIQQTTPRKPTLETSLELSFEPTPEVANPTPCAFGALLDAPILTQSSVDLRDDLNEEVSQLPTFDDCSSNLPPEQDSVLRDVSAAPRRYSIPSIPEQQLGSPILFSPNIPRTPKSARKLKRLNSSAKKDKPRSKPASPKHAPVIPGAYRCYFNGVERLNVLRRLHEYDKDALQIVLGYLADSDLVRVVAVSRGWRAIIESDRRQARRLRDYLTREGHSKENHDRSGSVCRDEIKLKVMGCEAAAGRKSDVAQPARQPFSLCNSLDWGNHSVMNTTVPKSPPVSPSRRKFHENQKIASHLKKSERLKPCPRCGKPSRVVAAHNGGGASSKTIVRSSSTKSTRLSATTHPAKLEKSYTLPDAVISPPPSPPSSSNSPGGSDAGDGSAERIRRNLFSTSSGGLLFPSRACSVDGGTPVVVSTTRAAAGTRRSSSDATPLDQKGRRRGQPRRRQSSVGEESQCDYAVCSGKGCGFTFCVKCLCEHHPDAVCKDLAPNSPSKEDAPVQYVACSKASRRSLRRLC